MTLADFPSGASIAGVPGLRVIGFERNASVAFVVKGNTIAILRILARRMDGPSDRTEQ
jgi:plasmid stabilization system protein ParE